MATATCETCGDAYDEAFELRLDGETHVFDNSFERAIAKLAPVCAHCQCRA